MVQAKIGEVILAESKETELVETNHYFPRTSVKEGEQIKLTKSDTPYTCHWKGETQYWNVVIDGEEYKDAAWSYEEPKEKAMKIKGYIAFDKRQVNIEE